MPYKSKKQEKFLRANKPEVAKKFDSDIKKMKKQGSSDRTNEKQGMEIKGIKDKMKKMKTTKKGKNPWMLHVAKVRKANKGMSLKEAMKKAKLSYKK